MPKGKAERVPHIAWTDHRIRQRPTEALNVDPGKTSNADLVPFFSKEANARDLGLGYYDLVLAGETSKANKAWQLLKRAQENDPADFSVLVALGYLAQGRGDNSESIAYYRSALKIKPQDPSAENNLAILLAKSGQLIEARNLWQETFKRNEAVDQPGVNLALSECMLGNKDAALLALRRVLVFSPDHPIAKRKLQAILSGQETCKTAH